jgi:hypothetical protein
LGRANTQVTPRDAHRPAASPFPTLSLSLSRHSLFACYSVALRNRTRLHALSRDYRVYRYSLFFTHHRHNRAPLASFSRGIMASMTEMQAPDHGESINRNRFPTLFEVLSRKTLPPLDLFSFYIYMRDQQRSVDYLDFW